VSALTLEEFASLPESEPSSEYACGEVYQKPMPDGPHSALQMFLGAVLYSFLVKARLGRVLPELRCIFGPPGRERSYVPDLAYVSNAQWPITRHLHAAPDLAIEVLSPDQHMPQFLDKMQFYLLYGVRLVWVVDPSTRTLVVHAPGQESRILQAGDILDGGDVLPGFSLAMDDLLADLP
jgi:Uma2 family endonuclease